MICSDGLTTRAWNWITAEAPGAMTPSAAALDFTSRALLNGNTPPASSATTTPFMRVLLPTYSVPTARASSRVVLLLGTNNLGHGTSTPAETVAGLQAVIGVLRQQCPAAVLHVFEVLERREGATPPFESVLRETTFNVVSIFSGTGFTSTDLSGWGPFPFAILFITGLIGGCTSSTGCSVKVFRYLILLEAVKVQWMQLTF